ncbi:hypothetical protein [Yinghuangia sp. YIM S10712]|uniref:hypothetical protein n=1 Tax=Yinghuangia sp. YIM S10712 TaxID=3436930 RepID=UPI003F5322B7
MQTPQGQKLGPTGQRVAANVEHVRGRMPLRELSGRLEQLGRKILPSGIMNAERGTRRVDVDDLVALALALEVSPNRLLLPAKADSRAIQLTPSVGATAREAWEWAGGEQPFQEMPWRPERVFDLDRWERFVDENQPHVEHDRATVEDDERWADVLAPVAEAVRVALAAGVPAASIKTVVDSAATMHNLHQHMERKRSQQSEENSSG